MSQKQHQDKSLILPNPSYLKYQTIEKDFLKLPSVTSEEWVPKETMGSVYLPY